MSFPLGRSAPRRQPSDQLTADASALLVWMSCVQRYNAWHSLSAVCLPTGHEGWQQVHAYCKTTHKPLCGRNVHLSYLLCEVSRHGLFKRLSLVNWVHVSGQLLCSESSDGFDLWPIHWPVNTRTSQAINSQCCVVSVCAHTWSFGACSLANWAWQSTMMILCPTPSCALQVNTWCS